MEKTVIELFAGVGGFRIGLNKIKAFDQEGKAIEKRYFKFVWANQWEPATKSQDAFDCYKKRFGGNQNELSNDDISLVDKKTIPDHTLLCGGFPCQDYSVAHSLSKEKGIEGKKGVLWWQIRDILEAKQTPFVLLENVDRLLKSPSKQRGKDFGIMLRCFNDLGYIVEWRVINAADYGHPQRRRRIFIFAYKNTTKHYDEMKEKEAIRILKKEGLFAKCFPVANVDKINEYDIISKYDDLVDVSEKFSADFCNAGVMVNGIAYTSDVSPKKLTPMTLRDVVENEVDEKYFLSNEEAKKYEFLRGSKKIKRTKPNGEEYFYSEGAMSPFDSLDLPGRTMLTSEGTTNRSTHIVMDEEKQRLRILTPVECERLQQFPDNWTNTGMPERRRYFMMGNALVCGIIEKLGRKIKTIIRKE